MNASALYKENQRSIDVKDDCRRGAWALGGKEIL